MEKGETIGNFGNILGISLVKAQSMVTDRRERNRYKRHCESMIVRSQNHVR